MTLLIVSFFAGILTVLAPCILPLLPIVIGSSVGGRSKATPFIVIGSLALSILLFTYLLKASTALIDIPLVFWSYLSGTILAGFGFILLFPKIWESLPFVSKTNATANQLLGTGHQKKSFYGDILIGASLGPIFSTCSPTYFVILGAVLPASFWLGTIYLLAYILGLVLVLSLIALLGQRFTKHLDSLADSRGKFKRGLGLIFIIIGLAIFSGYDKKLETAILNTNFLNISIFEQKILNSVLETEPVNNPNDNLKTLRKEPATTQIPEHLLSLFPKTDWSKNNPQIKEALSGGPTKDGIPAIDNPTFVSIETFEYSNQTQVIVVFGKNEIKAYPYNILTWHEIVNDTLDDTPITVTFCPLCGSAIVYDRTLPNGEISTFGVSGSLLESNMIMYDRKTENLWQQSTGEVLAGSFFPNKLKVLPFQLLTLEDVQNQYPDAKLLSNETGYNRDYSRNPYLNYEDNDELFFDPSSWNNQFQPKTIMVVFRDKDTTITVPWLKLREAGQKTAIINNTRFTLTVSDTGELTIKNEVGEIFPFYFEMWFSVFTQNTEQIHVIEL